MDAGDFAYVMINVGGGSKTIDVGGAGGAGTPRSHFSGFLVG